MCGICGAFGKSINVEKTYNMAAMLEHRGQDSRDMWVGAGKGQENCANGGASSVPAGFTVVFHALRMAVVDVENGRQPMHDGQIHLVWNGEIYNHQELRNTLEEMGYAFVTDHSDTEVILKLYQAYGADMVRYLRGMFAIALYDAEKEKLFLWRDRFGVKPLYYMEQSGSFWFASEIKALLAVERDTGKDADFSDIRIAPSMRAYLQYHCTVAPDTVYPDIKELEPGMEIALSRAVSNAAESGVSGIENCGELQIKKQRYYTLEFVPSLPSKDIDALEYDICFDECDAIAELRSHIVKAVDTRLNADERVDILLSGGLDSAYITALAAGRRVSPVYTHTLEFKCELSAEHEKQADVKAAEVLAKQLQTFHTTYTVTGQEALLCLDEIAAQFDQPYSGGVSLYWLMERVPEKQRVFLSGDGGDEAFWGYPLHRAAYDRLYRQPVPANGSESQGFPLPGLSLDFWKLLLEDDVWECLETANMSAGNDTFRSLSQQVDSHYYNILLPGQVLRYADTLSMAWGKEIRSPFMDQRVIEYASGLPVWMKMRNGDPKYLLKRTAENVLPRAFLQRKKETFLPPLFLWMQLEWKEYILDMLSFERLQRGGFFRAENVQFLLKQFYGEPEKNRQSTEMIWSVLMLELWMEKQW